MTKEEVLNSWSDICFCCAYSTKDYPTKQLDMVSDYIVGLEKIKNMHDEHIRRIAEEINAKYECCNICNTNPCDGHYPHETNECVDGVYKWLKGLV